MNINKSFNFNNSKEYYNKECIICFEKLGVDDIALLDCGHLYHNKCIEEWYISNKKSTCCICDKKATIINIEKRKNYFCCNII